MTRILRRAAAVATALAVLAGASAALADDLIVGEDDEVATNSDLPMSEVCATNGSDGYNGGNGQEVQAWLHRQLKAEGTGSHPEAVWAEGAHVAVTAPEDHANITTSVAAPGYITIPSDWTDSQNHTDLGPLAITVRVESTALGALTGTGPDRKVSVTAAGPSVDGPTYSDVNPVEVTATIVDASTAQAMDCTLPTASTTNPVSPQPDYVQNSVQNAAYSCDDAGPISSGIASCTGVVTKPDNTTLNVASGAALPTADLGVHTLRVTPRDNVGNVGAVVSRTYQVVAAPNDVYSVRFGQPIDGNGVLNKGKWGRVIPVKVNLSLNGTLLDDGTGGPLSIGWSYADCTATQADNVEVYVAAGSSSTDASFRWDGTQWIYNLDTTKLGAVNQCTTVFVLRDGAEIGSFKIQLTK